MNKLDTSGWREGIVQLRRHISNVDNAGQTARELTARLVAETSHLREATDALVAEHEDALEYVSRMIGGKLLLRSNE